MPSYKVLLWSQHHMNKGKSREEEERNLFPLECRLFAEIRIKHANDKKKSIILYKKKRKKVISFKRKPDKQKLNNLSPLWKLSRIKLTYILLQHILCIQESIFQWSFLETSFQNKAKKDYQLLSLYTEEGTYSTIYGLYILYNLVFSLPMEFLKGLNVMIFQIHCFNKVNIEYYMKKILTDFGFIYFFQFEIDKG